MKRLIVVASFILILSVFFGCRDTQKTTNNNDFIYEMKDETVTIILHEYDEEQTEISVPEFIEGKPVTTIDMDAFYQHKNTKAIILPSTIMNIYGSPFYKCYSLKEFFIPQNVKNIDSNPFFRCSSLTNITVDSENLYFSDEDGVLFNYDKTLLISYPEGKKDKIYYIPMSVIKIEGDAFGYCPQFEKLVVYSNVQEFPNYNMFVFPNDITMFVESNSAAEEYAKAYDIKYQIIRKDRERQEIQKTGDKDRGRFETTEKVMQHK